MTDREKFKLLADQLDENAKKDLASWLCMMADLATYGECCENPDFAGLLERLSLRLREAQIGVDVAREDWDDEPDDDEEAVDGTF